MANFQTSLPSQFENLPDEIILQILENLDIKSLANCVRVSWRIRAICRDVTTFQKINLYRREVPTGFLQLVLNFGCKYLCLSRARMLPEASGLCLDSPSRLIYLDLSFLNHHGINPQDIEKILASCHSLKKLSFFGTHLTPYMVKIICEKISQNLETLSLGRCRTEDIEDILASCNSLKTLYVNHTLTPGMTGSICMQNETLEVLNLGTDWYRCWKDIKQILEKCVKLKEICLCLGVNMSHDEQIYFINHLPLSIEKLDYLSVDVDDEFVSALVTRCKHLKSLSLRCCDLSGMTDDSVTKIINHLKYSLEELQLFCPSNTLTVAKLLELQSMPNLKVFNCYGLKEDEKKTLSESLPHLVRPVNDIWLDFNKKATEEGFWDVKCKALEIF